MKLKIMVLAGVGMMLAPAWSAVDELMPVPKNVKLTGGETAIAALAKVETEIGEVAGAPAKVADEAYLLDISEKGAKITATSDRGVRWAKVTLDQLKRLSTNGKVENCRIADWPSLKWRAFMADTGRTYLELPLLKQAIDGMVRYKLNLFHWHLSENYAWRIESKRHPELQSKEAFSIRYPGKYYTQTEFRELVDYAWERGVTILPEIDIPGHALAFRKAFGFSRMDAYGVDKLVVDLLDELCSLAPAEKMPMIHVGGDEVWTRKTEGVTPETLKLWAEAVAKRNRTLVNWIPGEKFPTVGPRVAMHWAGAAPDPKGPPVIDAGCMYIEIFDPFEILPYALFRRHFPWTDDLPVEKQLGAEFCAWHDGYVGYPTANFFRNQQIAPGFVIMGNSFWNDFSMKRPEIRCRMPLPDDPDFKVATEVERRVIAQRDRGFADCPFPFHFLRQSDMRWRVTDAKTGKVIITDFPNATITPFKYDDHVGKHPGNLITNCTGCVIAETWIKSPKTQKVGAWIGFTNISRDHGLVQSCPLPGVGEWNRFGATAELNGEKIAPPKWKRPGLDKGKLNTDWPEENFYEIDEEPFTDQEYYMREPTEIVLKEGWNHVKLTMPMTERTWYWSQRWAGTFIPLLGTTDHPREVPGLVYKSSGDGLR